MNCINKDNIPNETILNLGSILKEERNTAIKSILKSKQIDTNSLFDNFFSQNDNLTSSIIQIMSTSESSASICLDWFKEYFLIYQNYFGEPSFYFGGTIDINDKGRHIINSIKKYICILDYFDVFMTHMINTLNLVKEIRKKALIQMNQNGDKNGIIFIKIYLEREYEDYTLTNATELLTDEEIEKAKYISCEKEIKSYLSTPELNIVYYHILLTEILCSLSERFFINPENAHKFSDKNFIFTVIGKNKYLLQSINCHIEKPLIKSNDQLWIEFCQSDDNIHRSEILVQLNLKNSHPVEKTKWVNAFMNLEEKYIELLGEQQIGSYHSFYDENNPIYELAHNLYLFSYKFFPFGNWTIYSYLRMVNGTERKDLYSNVVNMEKSFIQGTTTWEHELILLMTHLTFDVNIPNSLIDTSNLQYRIEKGNYEIDRSYLWGLIYQNPIWYKSSIPKKFEENPISKALLLLINYGDKAALNILKNVIEHCVTNKLKIPSSCKFHFEQFIRKIGFQKKKRDYYFSLGIEWENLCQKIAKQKYNAILTNIENKTLLNNGKIPDIIVDKGVVQKNNKIDFAPIIIECKKSVYFAQTVNGYDFNNNEVVENYISHCEVLEFWILQKDDFDLNAQLHSRIKYCFAEDFCKDTSLPNDIIQSINDLLNIVNNQENKTYWDKNTDKITHTIQDIETLINSNF